MNAALANTVSAPRERLVLRGILCGGLLAGLADFIYPTVTSVMAGNPWTRPWKGVASGLLGRAANDGGIGTVAIGITLHFFICLAAAALLYFIASRAKWVPRQWIVLGILHGLAVLAVMNYVILPLSAIGRSIYPMSNMHVTAFFHILLVGWPTAFFIARALRQANR
jgi:hypothetical protein